MGDALGRLARVELHLAAGVMLTGTTQKQPALVTPASSSPLAVLEHTVNGCGRRLELVDLATASLARTTLSRVRGQLRAAVGDTDRAVRALNAALGRGETLGIAHAERPCRICGIRPQAMRGDQVKHAVGSRRAPRPSKGGRCDTCAKYFTRNGNERPRELDDAGIDEARAAARRRAARGDGWGAA